MILSQTPIEAVDQRLKELYGEAPPSLVPVCDGPIPDANKPVPPRAPPKPDELLLHQLPADALRELFPHVPLKFVLKLACRAFRDAWPERTELTLSFVCASSWCYRWAMRVGCPFVWGAELAAKMARHGCTNALHWAVMNGMACDQETPRQAAHGGHLETLARILAVGCPMDPNEVARKAASHGHVDILEWLVPKYNVKWGKIHTAAAARGGHLVALQWLRARRIPWDSNAVTQAAAYNHAEVVMWAVQNGGHLRLNAMWAAAERGHLEMVRLLRERLGCSMDAKTCGWAAYGGRLEVLQYLRSGQFPCPWDSETTERAAGNGHVRVLAWAMQQGCPVSRWAWAHASIRGHVCVLRFLHASGWALVDVKSIVDEDIGAEDHERTKAWLKRMRSPWQKVRKVLCARAVARYWQRLARPYIEGLVVCL